MTAPSERDVKRLFAMSGNHCAFPKCETHIAEGSALVGEICHICGRRPNAPRYDATQSEEARHGFDNLILLCANHHKVVDDDEESYPVERLRKMKATHEAKKQSAPPAEQIDQIVRGLIDQSVSSVGQSGGLTAHTVRADTINIVHGTNQASDPERAQAIKTLWNALVGLKSAFSDVLFTDGILLSSELDECFRGKATNAFFQNINHYSQQMYVAKMMQDHLPPHAERYRILITPRLWALYQVALLLYGRSAMLLTLSFKQKKLNDWRQDDILTSSLLSVFPQTFVEECKQGNIGGLIRIVSSLETAFLQESTRLQ
jgi:hypothetical protein